MEDNYQNVERNIQGLIENTGHNSDITIHIENNEITEMTQTTPSRSINDYIEWALYWIICIATGGLFWAFCPYTRHVSLTLLYTEDCHDTAMALKKHFINRYYYRGIKLHVDTRQV